MVVRFVPLFRCIGNYGHEPVVASQVEGDLVNEALQAQQRGKVRFVGDAPTGSEQVAQGFPDQIVSR